MNAEITAIVNQKGGVGKSFSCINIGIGLARAGKKVLLVDFDPQASMTIALGYPQPDQIPVTVTDLMTKIIEDEPIQRGRELSIIKKESIFFPPIFSYAAPSSVIRFWTWRTVIFSDEYIGYVP